MPELNKDAMSEYALEDLTPEQLEIMLSLATSDDERADIQRRYEYAQGLADSQMPQGNWAGRVYVPGNPLGFAAQGLRQAMGYKRMKEADQQLADLRQQRQNAINQFGQKLFAPNPADAMAKQQTTADILRTPSRTAV